MPKENLNPYPNKKTPLKEINNLYQDINYIIKTFDKKVDKIKGEQLNQSPRTNPSLQDGRITCVNNLQVLMIGVF